jgi:predicted amidohydrolase YtcJ
MESADLIFRNGKVITLDTKNNVAEALAIKDGRILATGTDEEIAEYAGERTEVKDLEGLTLTPGLISTHDHFLQYGLSAEFIIDIRYPKIRSCEGIASAIGERVRGAEAGKWILATGWDETLLDEKRFPNRWDLDTVSPGNPVWIRRVFQMGVANSKALEAAGITKETPDPLHGRIDRDDQGTPTGLLRGRAVDLVVDAIPAWTGEEMAQGLARACRDFNSRGITSVIEPGILINPLKAYRDFHKKGLLSVRSFIQYGFLRDEGDVEKALVQVEPGGDDLLRVIGLKFALDGGVGPRTALMYEPFLDQPDNTGTQLIPTEVLRRMTLRGHEAGFQIAIHAIGDKAIDITLDAYEHAQRSSPRNDPRHQIVHCYFPGEEALRKIVDLGVAVNTQAPFLYWLGDSFIESVGQERAARCIPLKTMMERGINVANSHDTTVTPPIPTIGLYSSVTRTTIRGDSMGEDESVTPLQAFQTYTTLASWHASMEEKIGSIEAGKYADLVIWDGDPLEVCVEGQREIEVETTLLAGRVVYSRA